MSSSSSSLPPTTTLHHHHPPKRGGGGRQPAKPPPISISTNPSDLDLFHLRHLLHSCNLSPHRFPALTPDGRVDPADVDKLRTAVSNSSVVVSAFCREKYCDGVEEFGFEQLFERAVPVPVAERRLVGFGRAVCDGGLTASIHDVAVTPSLQRLGIGRKIIQIITRYLTRKGIYDISALCSEKERLFFEACGFGNDYLGATTMMYTCSALTEADDNSMLKSAGRMMLLVPPPLRGFIQ